MNLDLIRIRIGRYSAMLSNVYGSETLPLKMPWLYTWGCPLWRWLGCPRPRSHPRHTRGRPRPSSSPTRTPRCGYATRPAPRYIARCHLNNQDYVLRISCSIPDPDPPYSHVFGPLRSGSISQRYGSGSGSFYHQAKIVIKKTWFLLFCDFFWTFYLWKMM